MNFNINKLVLIITLIILSSSLSISVVSAQTVIIADGSAYPGAKTTVAVTVNSVTDLANFDLTIAYDPAVVNVTSAVNNAAFGSSMNNLEDASTGVVRLVSFNTGSGQTGSNILLSTLTLKAVGTTIQTSTLNLTINSLLDSVEGDITATSNNGVFTISGAVTEPVVADTNVVDTGSGVATEPVVADTNVVDTGSGAVTESVVAGASRVVNESARTDRDDKIKTESNTQESTSAESKPIGLGQGFIIALLGAAVVLRNKGWKSQ